GAFTTNADSAEYLGVKKCKMCHIKQYKAWKKTNMATSFESLKSGIKAEAKKKAGLDPNKDYTSDAKCLGCHTTGYGKPGGFKSLAETPKLVGGQCEVCHGPGSDYRKVMMKNPKYKIAEMKAAGLVVPSEDEKGCLECHGSDSPFNEKVDPKHKFDFKERLKNTHKNFPLKYEH
ncbi:MAG: cytochrome c family protein, partial [Thermodesulfovibrionia bacterium]